LKLGSAVKLPLLGLFARYNIPYEVSIFQRSLSLFNPSVLQISVQEYISNVP
jgi:hypothetical protein